MREQSIPGEQTTLRIGNYGMAVDADVLQRLELLCDSDYMAGYLDGIIARVIDIYDSQDTPGDIITADEAMHIISTLHAARKDYRFLCSIDVWRDTGHGCPTDGSAHGVTLHHEHPNAEDQRP